MKRLVGILAVCALSMVAVADSANVLRNPGFESNPPGVNQSFPGWTVYGPAYGPNMDTNVWSENDTVAHGGTNAIKVSPDLTTYTVNFSGIFQDYMSGPGATWSASGWVYAPSASLLAGQNSGWIEVTFRDANATILALYRSSVVTNVAGGGIPQNTWVNLPVTNACDPGTFAATGTVSQLVAPAGTYFIRYRVVVRGDGSGAGGALYFDDLQLNSTGGTPYSGWNLAWSDEFNSTSVDTNTWTYDIDTGVNGWGNWELECYTSRTNNVYEGGGLLHIIAQQEDYKGSRYTSARIKTQGLFSRKYGRIEWRAKLPMGLGCWPALWLLGTNVSTIPWPGCGEIDVMENRGSAPTTVQASLHSGTSKTDTYQFLQGESDAASAFHTYTMDWATNAVLFYVDGHLYEMQTNWSSSVGSYPFPFNQPFFFIMNLAIGGGYLGYPAEDKIRAGTSFPAEMLVDYLRIYELTNLATTTLAAPLPLPWPVSANSVLVDFKSGDANDIMRNPDNGLYWNSVLISQGGGGAVPINGSSEPTALVNAANANSGIKLAITNLTGWNSSPGASWADYSGPYPAGILSTTFPSKALRDGLALNGSVSVTLSGLNPDGTYDLLIYGATVNHSSGNYTDMGNAQSNSLSVGTGPGPGSVRFNAYYNSTTVATWTNVTPSAGGQIALTISVPSGGSGGALNFLEVTPSPITNSPVPPTGSKASAGNSKVWQDGRPVPTSAAVVGADYPVQPVPFTAVHVTGGFWLPRQETNRLVTVPYALEQCETSKRLRNFELATETMRRRAAGETGFQNTPVTIFPFDDSDVYKAVEGASYTLSLHPDAGLASRLDNYIRIVSAAQEPDGYLYTFRTMHPDSPAHQWIDRKRWLGDPVLSHELYDLGHLYEAGVAHYQATRETNLLAVCLKSADLVYKDFGEGHLRIAPGHQVIEMGLVKLYRVTGDPRYLQLAKFFLDVRGPGQDPYNQRHLRVVDQAEAVGHVVRANYMYSGMADVAALTGDTNYVKAISKIWENVVGNKLHLTGGVGARASGEAYGDNYELPNDCYNETCAAIAFLMWNHRMFLLSGESKYMDVFERTLYNGFLSGVSLSGNRFFYPNPLEYDGKAVNNNGYAGRAPWFGCACCPPNTLRTLAALTGYFCAVRQDQLFVNLYAQSETAVTVEGVPVKLTQQTDYPWNGSIGIVVAPAKPAEFTLCFRLPGWVQGHPLPSDLYTYEPSESATWSLRVNGTKVHVQPEHGYLAVKRTWRAGDKVELDLNMTVRRVRGHEKIAATRERVALERGPVVYCLEGVDNDGSVFDCVVPESARISATFKPDVLGGATLLSIAGAERAVRGTDGKIGTRQANLVAIPYALWNNRGLSPMEVWCARTPETAQARPVQ